MAFGRAAEGELVFPQAIHALVPILRGRLPVLAAADGACGDVPERSVGATGGTVEGLAVAGDVTWPRRTGLVLVHSAAYAAAARDGGVEIPAIGDAHRLGGGTAAAACKEGPLHRRLSAGAQCRSEGSGWCGQGAGEDEEAQTYDHDDTSFGSGAAWRRV